MPHKKSKKSVRETATSARGYDNAPTSTDSFNRPFVVPSTSAAPAAGSGVLAPSEKKKRVKQPKFKVDTFGGRSDLGGLSKNVHRILNAGVVREQYHANKKSKLEDADKGTKKGKAKANLTPLPYESLSSFNRRVETALRPAIDTAIRASKAASKKASAVAKAKKAAVKATAGDNTAPLVSGSDGTVSKGKNIPPEDLKTKIPHKEPVDPLIPHPRPRATEFAPASQKRSIADLAIAPPSLKKARRGGEVDASAHQPIPLGRMPISDDLKRAVEMERAKAVRMYRELKEKREKEQLLE